MKAYYDEGGIQIYHGDCREVLPTLGSPMPAACMTDPPFSLPTNYHAAKGEFPRSWGDLLVMEPFFVEVFREIKRVVRDGQTYICCDAGTYPLFFKFVHGLWPDSQLVIWYKPTGRRGRGWLHAHELVLHLRTVATEYAEGWRQDVVGIMPVRTLDREHPAEKPGQLWEFLGIGLPTVTTIFDPFMGSGSVLAWAKDAGHRAIGIEIEERYCEIAAKRLGQGNLFGTV